MREFVVHVWRVARWVLLAIAALYVADIVYAFPHDHQEHLDKAAVAKISAQRITQADVDGSILPPPPEPSVADATLAGIDANDNGIRDDVELAIFTKYPTSSATSTTIRAGELQYAMENQMEFTYASNSATLVAVIEQEGRGYLCLPNESQVKEVEDMVFNTAQRQDFRQDIYKRYMASFQLDTSDFCDLDTNSK